jgi:HAMP domain-containing protein
MTETEQGTTGPGPGPLERLASRGDDALRRVAEELERASRLPEARDRLGQIERSVLVRLNVAPADEVEELRAKVAELEQRLLRAEELLTRQDAAESI